MDYYSEMYLYHDYIIILTVLLLIKYVYDLNTQNTEFYDEKVLKTSRENCGILCTKTYECSAFASDDNTCYLSKSNILGEPTKSPFMKEYNKKYFTCNKLQKVTDSIVASDIDLKKNATYVCIGGKNENNQNTQQLKIYDTKEKNLDNIFNLGKIKIDKYTFGEIDWGGEVTLTEKPVEKTIDKNKITLFTEQDDEFLGQYMYPHRCISNISQKNCLRQCLQSKKCLGTEWNPSYYKKINGKYKLYNNICCPKIKLKQNIPRRDEFKFGHFYLKKEINKNDDIE